MFDNDIYVNHMELDIKTLDDMYAHLRRILSYTGNDLQSAVLVLCAYSFYLTQEELSLLYPLYPAFTHLSARVFKPLEQAGYITTNMITSYSEQEGTARCFYNVTAQGYQYANSLCQGRLTSKYKRNRSKVARSHTYYIGYNLIQLMLLDYPLTWQREYLLNGGSWQRNNMVQVDAKCVLYEADGQKPFFTIYVEQDLGTEHNDALVGKLQGYTSYGVMDYPRDTLLMFSFSQKGVSVLSKGSNGKNTQKHPYSVQKCNSLIAYMESMHLDDLYDAYLTGYSDEQFITTLLLKVGAGKPKKDDGLKRGRNSFSLNDLRYFRDSINQKRNPYQHKDFNIIRSNFARARLEEMVKLLYAYIGKNEPFLIRMRRGYQVYYLPTTLVANRIGFSFLDKAKGLQEELETSLSILGKPSFKDVLSDDLTISKGFVLNLRNLFKDADVNVCVEFLAFDVSAWVRAMQFHKMYNAETPIQLVCVFETWQQVTDFYKAAECYIPDYDSMKSNILCLMLYDIGKEKRIFYLKDSAMERCYIGKE